VPKNEGRRDDQRKGNNCLPIKKMNTERMCNRRKIKAKAGKSDDGDKCRICQVSYGDANDKKCDEDRVTEMQWMFAMVSR
jgi:hypothetical protein